MRLPLAALFAMATAACLANSLRAHFVFVVPAKDNRSVQVVFSENLEPDAEVPIQRIADISLVAFSAGPNLVEIKHQIDKDFLKADLAEGVQVVRGSVTYGLLSRPNSKPSLLVYHPKALLVPAFNETKAAKSPPPVEIFPVQDGPQTRFQVVTNGKPAPGVEVVLTGPDGTSQKLPTGPDGKTQPVALKGRYAAWARHVVPMTGEHQGKKYEEIRHYATLVAEAR